jgi:predicted nucleic acid-binding protein
MPTSGSFVVVNSTPLISLDACNQLDLLRALYAQVIVPEAVERELAAGGTTALPKGLTGGHRKWIQIRRLRTRPAPALLAVLDIGEAEVIALALELGSPLVIIDEREAHAVAQAEGLQPVGTLGVLLRAKTEGLLTVIKPSIDLMVSKGVWFSKGLIESVLRLAGEAP